MITEKKTVTQQTALDDLVGYVRTYKSFSSHRTLDEVVKTCKWYWEPQFWQALQDPRYLAYCKEQDRVDEWRGKQDELHEDIIEKLSKPLPFDPPEQDRKEEEVDYIKPNESGDIDATGFWL